MVSNPIDFSLLHCPDVGANRIVLCTILSDCNNRLFDKKCNNFIRIERTKQWILEKLKKWVTAKP